MEKQKVFTEVVFNYIVALSSFSKLLFAKTMLDMSLKLSG